MEDMYGYLIMFINLGAYYPAQPIYNVILYSPTECIVCVFQTGSFERTLIFKNLSWGKHYVSFCINFILVSNSSRSDSIHREKLNSLIHIFIHLSYIVMTRCIESLRVAIIVFNLIFNKKEALELNI